MLSIDLSNIAKRSAPVHLISVRAFEITTSLWLAFNGLKNIGLARFLANHESICPPRALEIPFHLESILVRSGLSFTALSVTQIALAVTMISFGSGFLLRTLSALLALNAFNVCEFATDGGIDLLQNLLVLFAFCPSTHGRPLHRREPSLVGRLAVTAMRFQILVVYLTAGLTKMVEPEGGWKHGTALYYVLQVRGFSVPGFADVLLSSDVLVTIATYSAIVIQLLFVFLCFSRTRGWLALALMASVHLGIASMMGLVSFSLLMLSAYPIFFHDECAPVRLARFALKGIKWKPSPRFITTASQ